MVYTVKGSNDAFNQYKVNLYDLPIVYVDTPGKTPIISKDIWIDECSFVLKEYGSDPVDLGATSMKGRGNTTWGQAKKPYAVKFANKPANPILGMPAHKRWCLLANSWGYFFGNRLGYEMARRADGIAWAPHGKPVELFLNGKHLGCYVLTEQIKIDKERVNIKKLKGTDLEGEAVTGGYLLTFDDTFDEAYKFRSQYYNMPVMFKDPDEDVPTEQFNYIRDYINNFEASLKDSDRFANHEYLNYLDINSLIDVYFVWELAGNAGSGGTDFVKPRSVYYYKDRNGKLTAGPVWDFDTYLFCDKVLLCNNCQYYGRLFQDSYFIEKVKERWPLFKASLMNGSYTIIDYVNDMHKEVNRSAVRDRMMWPWSHYAKPLSADEQYEIIINGLPSKLDWLESHINSL